MLKEQAKLVSFFVKLTDQLLLVASFLLAFFLRQGPMQAYFLMEPLGPLSSYLWILLISLPLLFVLFSYFGIYESMRIKTYRQILGELLKPAAIVFFLTGSLVFIFRAENMSRSLVGLYFAVGFSLLLAEKFSLRALQKAVRRRGYNYRNILIVGTGKKAREFARLVELHRGWGLKVLGFIRHPAEENLLIKAGHILGSIDEFSRVLDDNVVDEVLITLPPEAFSDIQGFIYCCEEVGVKVNVATDFLSTLLTRATLGEIAGRPLLIFRPPHHDVLRLFLKRLADFSLSLVGLILLWPLFLLLALVIKATSRGPVFFRQTRCGRNGRLFTFYKFRSMVADAEARRSEVEALNEMSAPVFKVGNDPRVTQVGRFLRKFSLDELPQLWNVLKGEMSLVGPRPPTPEEVKDYQRWQRRRLSMKPGLTCLWQISGRNEVDFEEWMRLDLQYIDSWSLWLDFKILISTIPAVLLARGSS
ncbi:MAG: hypothetical protein AMS15_09620 [Planctomycetes bacterium DG_23]|nr:MAG: hypothetical protein AMS15_09620 [Planctomycetes bacterium DG_23]